MQIGSRRTRLVAGATTAWLIGVAWATVGNGMSTRAPSTAAAGHVDTQQAIVCSSRPARLPAHTRRRGRRPRCATAAADVGRGVQERASAQGHSRGRVHGDDGNLLRRPRHVLPGVSCPGLGRRLAEEDYGAQDDPDDGDHQSGKLLGRKVVTCWTCHRQSDRPSVTPLLDVVYGEPIY